MNPLSGLCQSFETSAWHPCGVKGTEANAASRWFGVCAEYEPLGRARRFWLDLRDSWVGVFTSDLLGDLEMKRRGVVVLYRRDSGQGVLTYKYNHFSEVEAHALSLASHLLTTDVFDLCRELGLSTDHVVGAGTDEPPGPVIWRETPTHLQASRVL